MGNAKILFVKISFPKQAAFTLVEVIVVIVIIGAIAGLALPGFQSSTETVRSREAVNILTALLGAQNRYAMENGGVFTNVLNDLDVTIPTPGNFAAPTVSAAVNPTDVAVTIVRSAGGFYGSYTLTITRAGAVACAGGSGGICSKIGY